MKAIIEHGNIVAVEFTNRVIHKDDIVILEDLINSVKPNFNYINILILITQLESITFRACLESIKMLIDDRKDIKKIAVISDKSVYLLGTRIENLFTPWKEKYFDISELNSAWEWLKTND